MMNKFMRQVLGLRQAPKQRPASEPKTATAPYKLEPPEAARQNTPDKRSPK